MVVDLKRKESDLLQQLQGHSKADEAFLISSSYVLELANRAEELFEKSQARQKNELLRFVLANASVEGEKLVYKLKNPFAAIVLCNETGNWLGRRDSNPRMHGPKPCALPLGDAPTNTQHSYYTTYLPTVALCFLYYLPKQKRFNVKPSERAKVGRRPNVQSIISMLFEDAKRAWDFLEKSEIFA